MTDYRKMGVNFGKAFSGKIEWEHLAVVANSLQSLRQPRDKAAGPEALFWEGVSSVIFDSVNKGKKWSCSQCGVPCIACLHVRRSDEAEPRRFRRTVPVYEDFEECFEETQDSVLAEADLLMQKHVIRQNEERKQLAEKFGFFDLYEAEPLTDVRAAPVCFPSNSQSCSEGSEEDAVVEEEQPNSAEEVEVEE